MNSGNKALRVQGLPQPAKCVESWPSRLSLSVLGYYFAQFGGPGSKPLNEGQGLELWLGF